ncbi:hydantoinase/oxoprolinase family protein [Variovorax sp. CCNWLW186]|uniref:hydantoinase/oxoprolinase family protein n=1 Tax=Variovorax sp. CCNWLW186 TaxID=3127473 RepID=UPI003077DFB0
MPTPERITIGWDIGGAHVKACLLQGGEVVDVAQWGCPLWQGLDHLARALQAARTRWPVFDTARHAVTMTGEMVDLFPDREAGVRGIAAALAAALPSRPGALHFFAGDAGWCAPAQVTRHWEHIASANWLATARHAALVFPQGVLVDIGSTTTDLIAFGNERVLATSRTDAERLVSGELAYHGVVRTPVCALTQRIEWRGRASHVMNEFFATTADVYRLCGELDPAHDLYPSADNAAKSLAATRQRLARMVGLDERDASAEEWLELARAWRAAQVEAIGSQLRRVLAVHALSREAVIVSAGCGAFLVPDLAAAVATAASAPHRFASYGGDVANVARHATPGTTAWAQVCAPSVAAAALFEREHD